MAALLKETLATPGNIMLSGGATPYAIYNQLAQAPCPVVHPNRTLFLSDERMVPADSPQNNYFNLRPMLNALQCETQAVRVQTERPIEQAAQTFAQSIAPLKTIDIGLLGMGADGHTAGIFNLPDAANKQGALVIHSHRPDGMQGISVTPSLFNRVKRIILLVTGESKREIINTLRNAPSTIPAGIALADHPNTELWTDIQ